MGTVHVTGAQHRAKSTVGSFIANLPELLGAMAVDPRCLVAIAEFGDVRYVQFWVEANGDVIAEVISNLNIGDAVALSERDEELLRELGWTEPSPGPNPNWRFEGSGVSGLVTAVSMTSRAVYDVLREDPANDVDVRTWEMPERRDHERDRLREEARVWYQDRLRGLRRHVDAPHDD